MKKLFALTLITLMLLSICACAPKVDAEAVKQEGYDAGYEKGYQDGYDAYKAELEAAKAAFDEADYMNKVSALLGVGTSMFSIMDSVADYEVRYWENYQKISGSSPKDLFNTAEENLLSKVSNYESGVIDSVYDTVVTDFKLLRSDPPTDSAKSAYAEILNYCQGYTLLYNAVKAPSGTLQEFRNTVNNAKSICASAEAKLNLMF